MLRLPVYCAMFRSLVNFLLINLMQLQLLVISTVFAVSVEAAGQAQCGSISEGQLIRQDNYAVPTEHQWLARITYANGKWSA